MSLLSEFSDFFVHNKKQQKLLSVTSEHAGGMLILEAAAVM